MLENYQERINSLALDALDAVLDSEEVEIIMASAYAGHPNETLSMKAQLFQPCITLAQDNLVMDHEKSEYIELISLFCPNDLMERIEMHSHPHDIYGKYSVTVAHAIKELALQLFALKIREVALERWAVILQDLQSIGRGVGSILPPRMFLDSLPQAASNRVEQMRQKL